MTQNNEQATFDNSSSISESSNSAETSSTNSSSENSSSSYSSSSTDSTSENSSSENSSHSNTESNSDSNKDSENTAPVSDTKASEEAKENNNNSTILGTDSAVNIDFSDTGSSKSSQATLSSSSQNSKTVFEYKLATNGERVIAYLIDSIIISFVSSIVSNFVGYGLIIHLVIAFAYFAYMESQDSAASLGKQIMKIKVISAETGKNIGEDAYTRSAFRILSSIILGIGFLLAFFDAKNQTLHDQLAKTYVVKDIPSNK